MIQRWTLEIIIDAIDLANRSTFEKNLLLRLVPYGQCENSDIREFRGEAAVELYSLLTGFSIEMMEQKFLGLGSHLKSATIHETIEVDDGKGSVDICPDSLVGEFDEVSNPMHYTDGRIYEPRKVIVDWGLPYYLGNVVRYISRAGRKESRLTDLKKAKQYLEWEIERIEEGVAAV